MVIKNYRELKMFLEKDHRINKRNITNIEISEEDKINFKAYYGQELIIRFDNEGNYTSYPNEELKQNKFKIRKKIIIYRYQNIGMNIWKWFMY